MRIVVKLGTSTLTHPTGCLNIRRIESLCKTLSDLKNMGHEILMVSSGAIAMGVGKLLLPGKPGDIPTKQAAAAVGQCELMYTYDKLFSEYHHTVAQILLNGADVENPERYQNFQNTCWSFPPYPLSMKTTPWSPMKFGWVTTTHWAPLWPSA